LAYTVDSLLNDVIGSKPEKKNIHLHAMKEKEKNIMVWGNARNYNSKRSASYYFDAMTDAVAYCDQGAHGT
jgi:hypothetical protein